MQLVKHLILIATGGGIGSMARYLTSVSIAKIAVKHIYLGTLTVNILGSFLIGILWAMFEGESLPPSWRFLLVIGFLGGFTTFSSFSIETINLFKSGEIKTAILYVLASNLFSISAAFGGYLLSKIIS